MSSLKDDDDLAALVGPTPGVGRACVAGVASSGLTSMWSMGAWASSSASRDIMDRSETVRSTSRPAEEARMDPSAARIP